MTFDGDLYYIDFKHKIQSYTDANNNVYTTNDGGATYSGIEFQATYVFPYGFSIFANYSRNNAVAKDDTVNPGDNGYQLPGAPRWTAAGGLRYERSGVIVPDGRLVMNITDKWIGSQEVNTAIGLGHPYGLIKTYSDINFTGTFSWRNYSIEGQILNLGDSHALTAAKGKILDPSSPSLIATSPTVIVKGVLSGNTNQFTYDTGRSFQVTLKVAF